MTVDDSIARGLDALARQCPRNSSATDATTGARVQSVFVDARDWFVATTMRGVHAQTDFNGFYARIDGPQLRLFPNIHVSVPPIIDFMTHQFEDPNWYMKFRQRCRNGWTSSPRLSIINRASKNTYLKFNLSKMGQVKTLEELFEMLRRAGGKLSVANINVHDTRPSLDAYGRTEILDFVRRMIDRDLLDEALVVDLFNQARYRRIKNYIASDVDLPIVTVDNVISIIDDLARRRASETAMSDDLRREVDDFLEMAA